MSDLKMYIRIRQEGCECSGCVVTIEQAIDELKIIHDDGEENISSGFVFESVSMTEDDFNLMPEFHGF